MTNLWDQLNLIEITKLSIFKAYIDQRKEWCLVRFLMVTPLFSVESLVNELLTGEIGLKSHSNIISNQ